MKAPKNIVFVRIGGRDGNKAEMRHKNMFIFISVTKSDYLAAIGIKCKKTKLNLKKKDFFNFIFLIQKISLISSSRYNILIYVLTYFGDWSLLKNFSRILIEYYIRPALNNESRICLLFTPIFLVDSILGLVIENFVLLLHNSAPLQSIFIVKIARKVHQNRFQSRYTKIFLIYLIPSRVSPQNDIAIITHTCHK